MRARYRRFDETEIEKVKLHSSARNLWNAPVNKVTVHYQTTVTEAADEQHSSIYPWN
jgi:hypothetical protein